MGRLDWDRLRRTRPLDGADLRVDPDGEQLWEQAKEEHVPFGARRLRPGVIVRGKVSADQTRSPSSHGSKSVPK